MSLRKNDRIEIYKVRWKEQNKKNNEVKHDNLKR